MTMAHQPGESAPVDNGMAPTCAVEGDASAPIALEGIRGRLTREASLAKHVWFRSGGKADWLFEPADLEDLKLFLEKLDGELPVMALGVGSNMIIRDGGVPGVVMKLGRPFNSVEVTGETTIAAGAAALPAARLAGAFGNGRQKAAIRKIEMPIATKIPMNRPWMNNQPAPTNKAAATNIAARPAITKQVAKQPSVAPVEFIVSLPVVSSAVPTRTSRCR